MTDSLPDVPDLSSERLAGEARMAVSTLVSYGAVLALIAVTYLVAAMASKEAVGQAAVVVLQSATFLLVLLASRPRRFVAVVGVVLAAAIAIAALLGALLLDDASGFTAVLGVVLLALALASLLVSLAHARRATTETVLGAVDAYLLVGLLFAFVFAGFGSRDGFLKGAAREVTNGDFLVFSYGNLTTLGSSNLVVESNVISSLAVLEAMIGQIFLVTVIARLVSLWAAPPSAGS